MITTMVIAPQQLQHMDAQELRALAEGLMAKLVDKDQLLISKDQEIHFKQTKIDLLTHEIARYKRVQFAAKSEKLDYAPGIFTVERHVRGKWACGACQKLVQAPVPAQVIDKGIPTSGLLADVAVSKFGDHLPLYRLESIYARAGVPLPRSTLAQWMGQCGVQLQPLVDALIAEMLAHAVLHADETPVQMLKPGTGKTPPRQNSCRADRTQQ